MYLKRHILFYYKSQDLDISRKAVSYRKVSNFTSFFNFLTSEMTSFFLFQFPELQQKDHSQPDIYSGLGSANFYIM